MTFRAEPGTSPITSTRLRTSYMIEPKPTPHRPQATCCLGLLAFIVALATAVSPNVAMARNHSVRILAPVGPTDGPGVASGPLRIEVEPAIDDASLLTGWILEREGNVARNIPLVKGHDQWIAVQIGGATYDYRVSVTPMRDGVPLETVKAPEVCECNSEALLALLDGRIAAAAAALRVPPPEEASKREREPTHDPFASDSTTNDVPRRLGTMGSVGIGVAVLGAGLLSAGIPLAFRPEDIRGGPGGIETRSTHGPGIGMALAGGVALVTGMSLLAVDLARHRQRALAVVPALGPRYVGLVIAWRLRGRVIR